MRFTAVFSRCITTTSGPGRGSSRIRRLATELPLECLVLETDAPDIPPSWLPRGRNSPAQLAAIGRILAELRQHPLELIAAQTRANTLAALPGLADYLSGTAGAARTGN